MTSHSPEQSEHLFPELHLPDNIDDAILVLENDLFENIQELRANMPTVDDPIAKQITYTIAAGRVRSDSEVLTMLHEVRDKGGTLELEEL